MGIKEEKASARGGSDKVDTAHASLGSNAIVSGIYLKT